VSFIEGHSRDQINLLPPCIDDYVAPDALVRVVDAFVASLDLVELGFSRAIAAATGRPGFQPGDMLRLYIWGYLNQVRSSRHLERACVRDLEALWLLRRLAPDYRTIAAFRHDNPEAIIAVSAAFVEFCRDRGLVGGRVVAVDGTKMRAVASPKNIAGAERLGRDIAHKRRLATTSTGSTSSTRRWRRGSTISRYTGRTSLRPLPRFSAGRTGLSDGGRSWNVVMKRCSSSANLRPSRWATASRPNCLRTISRVWSMSRVD